MEMLKNKFFRKIILLIGVILKNNIAIYCEEMQQNIFYHARALTICTINTDHGEVRRPILIHDL